MTGEGPIQRRWAAAGLLAAALLLLPLGCGGPEADGEPRFARVKHAIMDGYADAETSAVVAVVQPAQGVLCSGTLIAPNVVLTAGHCVASTSGDDAGVLCNTTLLGSSSAAKNFWVSSAAAVTTAGPAEYQVVEVVRLPGGNPLFCGNDAAVLILSELAAAALTPIEPRVAAPLADGMAYSAVGYGGIDNNGTGAGERRRRDGLMVGCVGDACGEDQVRDNEWIGGGGVCQGDSGGPALDSDGRVAGIASRGSLDCGESLYSDTYSWRNWLKDTVVYASGVGTYQAPAWTDGSTVNPEHSMPLGGACMAPGDCPSGRCIDGDEGKYCTRICDAEAACPEDYYCEAYEGLEQCVYHAPVVQPPFQAPPRDECSVARVGGQPAGAGWLLLLGAPVLWRRRGEGWWRG